MTAPDDKRLVTTTVARLKAYEAATLDVARKGVAKWRATDALGAAQRDYEAALTAESDAIDAALAATKMLYEPTEATP